MRSDPLRPISEDEVARFRRDGVVHLVGILDPVDVASMEGPVDDLIAGSTLADLTAMAGSLGANRSERDGAFVSGVDHWLEHPPFADLAVTSALPAVAAQLLGSAKVNLYEDSVLVKEPEATEATARHQDLGYFHVTGGQICTMWVPLDPVDRRSGAVYYLPGSHRTTTVYRPNFFVSDAPLPGTDGPAVPSAPLTEPTWFESEPGDVIVHDARTLHGAFANRSSGRRRAISIRYCGDDVRYHLRPGAPRKPHHVPELEGQPLDHPCCPVVWPRPT